MFQSMLVWLLEAKIEIISIKIIEVVVEVAADVVPSDAAFASQRAEVHAVSKNTPNTTKTLAKLHAFLTPIGDKLKSGTYNTINKNRKPGA
jgi:hypothetical protein